MELSNSLTECAKGLEKSMKEAAEWMARAQALFLQLEQKETDLQLREGNVVHMEASIRSHMEERAGLEEKLEQAKQKENGVYLRQQLLEEQLKEISEQKKQLEESLGICRRQNHELESKLSELALINQKLTTDKAKLLQAQVQGGKKE